MNSNRLLDSFKDCHNINSSLKHSLNVKYDKEYKLAQTCTFLTHLSLKLVKNY